MSGLGEREDVFAPPIGISAAGKAILAVTMAPGKVAKKETDVTHG